MYFEAGTKGRTVGLPQPAGWARQTGMAIQSPTTQYKREKEKAQAALHAHTKWQYFTTNHMNTDYTKDKSMLPAAKEDRKR